MAKAKVLIDDTEEAIIKNALDVDDMNEVNINVTRKKKTGFLGTYWGLTLSGTKTHVKQRFLPLTPLLMVSDVLWSPVLPA
ncbi:hypothetical protein ACTXEJ_004838 [Escherichia coli]